jgi:AcrR family transcriptional regulator
MRDETKAKRRAEIEAAAYDLMMRNGYDAMSMLGVAKAAHASNETLYRWYGDKQGLFRAMIVANADLVRDHLDAALPEGRDADPLAVLRQLCPVLLGMLVGGRAVALNRAAAADASGALGAALAEAGRAEIAPRITRLIASAIEAGALQASSAPEAAEWLLGLLIGDWQIRRVTGAMTEPSADEIAKRAEQAWAGFCRLCGADRAV